METSVVNRSSRFSPQRLGWVSREVVALPSTHLSLAAFLVTLCKKAAVPNTQRKMFVNEVLMKISSPEKMERLSSENRATVEERWTGLHIQHLPGRTLHPRMHLGLIRGQNPHRPDFKNQLLRISEIKV